MNKQFKYPVLANNYYEQLGLTPSSNPSKNELETAYSERFKYWRSIKIPDMSDVNAALHNIGEAKKVLLDQNARRQYDAKLKSQLVTRLDDIIEAAIKIDKELDPDEEKHIIGKGGELGFSLQETQDRIKVNLNRLGARKVGRPSRQQNQHPPPSPKKQTQPRQKSKTGPRNLIIATGLTSSVSLPLGFLIMRSAALTVGLIFSLGFSVLFCIGGLVSINKGKKDGWATLLVGTIILFFTSKILFFLFTPMVSTWLIAKPAFNRFPARTSFVIVIPAFTLLFNWFGYRYFTATIGSTFLTELNRKNNQQKRNEPDYPKGHVTAPLGANVRSGASKNATAVGTIKNGVVVSILGKTSGWYKIRYQQAGRDITGYIYEELLGRGTNSPPQAGQHSKEQIVSKIPPKLPDKQGEPKSAAFRPLRLIGSWYGTFSGKAFIIEIESYQNLVLRGYTKLNWPILSHPEKTPFVGAFDKQTRAIILVEQGSQNSLGEFTGTIASDGYSIKGVWNEKGKAGAAQNWHVRKR